MAATTAIAATRIDELRKDEVKALINLRARLYHARPTASETKRPMRPATVARCDYFAQSLSKAANEARALAAAHERIAKE